MNNPPPQFATSSSAPDNSRPISEASYTDTESWASSSEASNEDDDEGAVDSLADDGCADEAYWEENAAVDAWLARFPGGISSLYPQLFMVKPRGGKVVTPPRYPNHSSLLHLPSEIRNRIYKHYFDEDEEVKHPKEGYTPFRDREGIEMQRICLSSENVELKFWLSTALLQTSRQLRFEAMFVLLGNRVITVEWLPILPRFVEFLGKEGCAMVRYLDIWDALGFRWDNNASYQDIITGITRFSSLQHLRVVLSWGIGGSGPFIDRTYPWFDQNDWKSDGTLKEQAVPKIRSEDIERYWPEYGIFKHLEAQKLTLAVVSPWSEEYLEFDRSHGAHPEISAHAASTQSESSSANFSTSSISPGFLKAFKGVEIQHRSSALTPNAEPDHEEPDSPTWQETDTLANKTIPIYNFLRESFHNSLHFWPMRGGISVNNFVTFPTAQKSTGGIIQDCAFCYLGERHCGHHAVPDQPPFEPTRLEGDEEQEDVKTLQRRFEYLSYVDMRRVCQDVVRWMTNVNVVEFGKVAAIFDYLGWPEARNSECLARLDAAVEAGWTGKRVDKEEVPPWDVLYREIYSRYRNNYNLA